MKTNVLVLNTENVARKVRISLIAVLAIIYSSMALAQTTVVDVIVGSENHNTLEAAVVAAELADDLSGKGPFTVFAPTDAAFAALPEGTVEALLKDPTGDLAQILLYHAVGSKAMSSDLSDGQMIATLNGSSVTVKFKDSKVYIDKAMVTMADIEADNGVVHVLDAVIIPSPAVAANSGGCQTP